MDVASFPGADEPVCQCQDADHDVHDEVFVGKHAAMLQNASVRWNGIADVGRTTYIGKHGWKKTFGGTEISLRPGFTSIREVETSTGEWVNVVCKVLEKKLNGELLPSYECTVIVHGAKSTSLSLCCRTAVREILQKVDAVTKHKWAEDFFGFHLSSVSTLLSTAVLNEPSKKRSCSSEKQLAPILVKLQNLRNRGGGPTSELRRKEDRDRRNAAIDDAISFASFNDVKSMYIRNYVQRSHCLCFFFFFFPFFSFCQGLCVFLFFLSFCPFCFYSSPWK